VTAGETTRATGEAVPSRKAASAASTTAREGVRNDNENREHYERHKAHARPQHHANSHVAHPSQPRMARLKSRFKLSKHPRG
jgi:hypothetical protein